MKASGVRYLQFIPCLDPLDTPQGQQNYSLTPELYAQFLCALFDAWYRDWKTSTYVSIRLFEDYVHLLLGGPAGPAPQQAPAARTWSWRAAAPSTPCDFFCLDAYKLGTVQNDTLQSLLTGEKCGRLSRTAGRYPQSASNASGSTCAVAAANVTATLPTKYGAVIIAKRCKVFCLRRTAPVRNGSRCSNVPLKRRQILLDKKNKYWRLFLSTFKLSACTFGGGFVIILSCGSAL